MIVVAIVCFIVGAIVGGVLCAMARVGEGESG